MNYQSFDYDTRAEDGTWTPAPVTTQMVAAPPNTQLVAAPTNTATSSDVMVLGSMLQSMQQTQMQQMYLMRDFDSRIGRLEQAARPNPPAGASFERMTWWAIWGLLMLILGGTLTVVIILILMNVQFR